MPKFFKSLQNKWFIAGGSIFLLFLIAVLAKQMIYRHSIQKEINSLSGQASDLQKNNKDLQDFIAYLKTDSYKQVAARQQLNLQKPGEVVYSFTDQQSAQSSAPAPSYGTNGILNFGSPSVAPVSTSAPKANFSNWLKYFFNSGRQ